MKILILNGPNLNLLGVREPDKYGSETLASLQESLTASFPSITLSFFQSNHEGELIDRLQTASSDDITGIVFNPGGYTHSSVAIRDAIAAIEVPVVEVHITNIASRESFRHVSVTSGPTVGQISGFGSDGYAIAVRYFTERGTSGGDGGSEAGSSSTSEARSGDGETGSDSSRSDQTDLRS